jgi:hypothetical protein
MREADGEVVWFQRPDADAKLATMLAHRAGDGGNKARSPGRARRKPLKPLRRKRRIMPAEPVVTLLVCFFHSHARLRVRQRIRRFLRPLMLRVVNMHDSGEFPAAGTSRCVWEERLGYFTPSSWRARSPDAAQRASVSARCVVAALVPALRSNVTRCIASGTRERAAGFGVTSLAPSMIARTSSGSLRYARDDDV